MHRNVTPLFGLSSGEKRHCSVTDRVPLPTPATNWRLESGPPLQIHESLTGEKLLCRAAAKPQPKLQVPQCMWNLKPVRFGSLFFNACVFAHSFGTTGWHADLIKIIFVMIVCAVNDCGCPPIEWQPALSEPPWCPRGIECKNNHYS